METAIEALGKLLAYATPYPSVLKTGVLRPVQLIPLVDVTTVFPLPTATHKPLL